jgi:anti-sigma factor RsiW
LIPCSNRDWQAYIKHQLQNDTSLEYEEHLYACDACLELYMEVVEALQQPTSVKAINKQADKIMAQIQSENHVDTPEKIAVQGIVTPKGIRRVPLTRRPLFQYGVAAILTLMLMSAGVFQGLSHRISHIESKTNRDQQESFSQKLMEKTVAMLDAVQTQPKGGGKP